MKQKEMLKKFLRREVYDSAGEEPEAVKLFQIIAQGQHSTLTETKLECPGEMTDDDFLEMAGQFIEIAQEDANGRSSVSSYCLVTYREKEAKSKSPTFRMQPQQSGIVVGDSEPGTPTGLLQQSYRHIEAQMRINMQMFDATMGHMSSVIARQQTSLERFENNHREVIQEREEMVSDRFEREVQLKKEESNQKRLDQIMGTITPLLPLLANRLLGGKNKAALVPAGQEPMLRGLKDIVDSLTEEQLAGVMQALGDKAIPLLEVLSQIEEATREKPNSSSPQN